MVSRDAFDEYVNAQRAVRKLARADVRKWWSNLPDYTPDTVKAAAVEFLPVVVAKHGETSATLAADWYDTLRDEAAPRKPFAARMATPQTGELLDSLRYQALGPMFRAGVEPDPVQTLANLEDAAEVLSLKAGRDTLIDAAAEDKAYPRWARVPVGTTCAWCLMLASRGAVYDSAASAGDETEFHAACDCQPTPVWDGEAASEQLPDGYSPLDLERDQYQPAVDLVKSQGQRVTDKTVAAAMRELHGLS